MLSVFWDRRGVIHWELLPANQTITAQLYCEQLERVRKKLRNRKLPVLVLHDNARPHVARLTQETLARFDWEHLAHAPYSPDMAPSDYHLFRALEHFLRGKKFEAIDEMLASLEEFFISKDRKFYHNGIHLLLEKWQKVIESGGEYFEE